MRRLGDGPLARSAGRVGPGSFSMVMATGIVAAALRQYGLTPAADVVLAIAAAGFVVLAAATGWRWATQPAAQQADLTSPGRAFAAFTFTAACGVLGLGLTTVGWPAAGAVLAVAGTAAWLALTALIPARMTASRRARPAIADVNGTWYLWAVATQSLAIMAAFLHTGGALGAGPAAAVALAAWLAGLAIYVLTMAAVVTRLRRVGVGPPGARAGYWVAMGAASISMLAAVHFLGIHGAPVVASARPWITDTAIALWWLATCLIVVLAVATAVMWPRSWRRPSYDRTAWMVVFPLGMYATASQQLGATAGLPAVRMIGEGVTWPAAVAWLAVLAALAAPLLTRAGGRARVAVGLREPPAPHQLGRRQRGFRPGRPEPRATRKYQALLKLAPHPGGGDTGAPLPWPMRAVVRAQDHRTRAGRLFTALVTAEDEAAEPGNSHVIATMVVIGAHPDDCLGIGDSFALWRGTDVASGVITRRLFT
jgi:tellurite resistance protein TehA-like permease